MSIQTITLQKAANLTDELLYAFLRFISHIYKLSFDIYIRKMHTQNV